MPYLTHLRPDHDETLVARLLADDLDDREVEAARTLVAECPACAELLTDLRAIVAATATLPPPRRPRDFRLTEADAAALRPAGWRGLLRGLREPRLAFTRPLAMGLATLGIAGLLLAALPSGFGGSAASILSTVGNRVSDTSGTGAGGAAPAPEVQAAPSSAASAAPAAAASGLNGAPAYSSAGDKSSTTAAPSPAAFGAYTPPGDGGTRQALGSAAEGSGEGPSPLVVVSVGLLLAGLALGGLRWAARRLA